MSCLEHFSFPIYVIIGEKRKYTPKINLTFERDYLHPLPLKNKTKKKSTSSEVPHDTNIIASIAVGTC